MSLDMLKELSHMVISLVTVYAIWKVRIKRVDVEVSVGKILRLEIHIR